MPYLLVYAGSLYGRLCEAIHKIHINILVDYGVEFLVIHRITSHPYCTPEWLNRAFCAMNDPKILQFSIFSSCI